MRHTPWIAAYLILAAALYALAQTNNPITPGQFSPASTAPAATLVLLNQSRLSDSTLGEVANALSRRVLNVELATRLSGPQTAVCGQGEWCLAITDQMLGNGGDVASGAKLGAEITREIVRRML